jgi:GTPase
MKVWHVTESLEELERLTRSAGGEVILSLQQKKSRPDPAYFIGRGKADELIGIIQDCKADTLIFDEDLSPAQQRNLETLLEVKIVDRTELILDIFAQRAHTKEGKLQVELAQLHYLLPRLTGKGVMMSRLGGGIGTRGPGETKLEVDRRRIRARISYLESYIEDMKENRAQQRSKRKETQIPVVALVGYTNAGKSTLLNQLCGSDVLVQDKLFATLDPTTRKLDLPNGQSVLVTDTVGFIRKLPHHLVAAFRATLEEIRQADLLLHVVDSSHPNKEDQISAVLEVLKELEVLDKPILTLWNKIDKLPDGSFAADRLVKQYEPSVAISAQNNLKMNDLFSALVKHFDQRWKTIRVLIPHSRADLVAQLHQNGKVSRIKYLVKGIKIEAQVLPNMVGKFSQFELS